MDKIVRPDNGPASRAVARAVAQDLLPHEPYRSYGITLDRFFDAPSPRMLDDLGSLANRRWGWHSDQAILRDVAFEAIRTHPVTYARGVARSFGEMLQQPLYRSLGSGGGAPAGSGAGDGLGETIVVNGKVLPKPSEGEPIPAAHQGFFSTTPDGSVTEVWTSATDHGVVFADPRAQRRFADVDADTSRLDALVPPYPGSRWLTLQFSRSSKLFPPPLLWLVVGIVAWAWRRPARMGVAACLAVGALLVVSFQALAVYSIIEFAVPVAPAFVVFGAAGLLGDRRPTR